MLTRRGFLGVVGGIGAWFVSSARVVASRFRPESQIRLFDYDSGEGRFSERSTGMLPVEDALDVMKHETDRMRGIFAQYKTYGPFEEPAYLTRMIDEGMRDAQSRR